MPSLAYLHTKPIVSFSCIYFSCAEYIATSIYLQDHKTIHNEHLAVWLHRPRVMYKFTYFSSVFLLFAFDCDVSVNLFKHG